MSSTTMYRFQELLSWRRGIKFFLCFLAVLIFVIGIGAQSLWRDHNPYSLGTNLRQGTVLKLSIDEPVVIAYEYTNLADENIDINLIPDRGLTGFLPPANAKNNISKRFANRLNSRSHIHLHMAVTLESDPENDSVRFTGRKALVHEDNISRQQIQVSGSIHIEDIESGRRIHSRDVANLEIVVLGAPVPRSKELPLIKEEKEEQPEGGSEEAPQQKDKPPAAQLSEEQKQQLLWEYINRILGESRQ